MPVRMQKSLGLGLGILIVCVITVRAQDTQVAHLATIQAVAVRGTTSRPILEVILNRPTVPTVMTLTNPDRLVLDFSNTEPGTEPQHIRVRRGGLEAVRIGESGATPPVTRIVLDLSGPRDYRLEQATNRVVLKLGELTKLASQNPSVADQDPDDAMRLRYGTSVKAGRDRVKPALLLAENRTADSSDAGSPIQIPRSVSLPSIPLPPVTDVKPTGSAEPSGAASNSKSASFPTEGIEAGFEQQLASLADSAGEGFAAFPFQTPADVSMAAPLNRQPEDPPAVSNENLVTVEPGAESDETVSRPITSPLPAVKKYPSDPSSYRIGPNDVLTISVWHEQQLSQTLPVRPDGKISLPLIGEIQASGKTPLELQADVRQHLREFLEQPEVSVIVQEAKSRRFNIFGQIGKPGSYSLNQPLTILDALAIAGGFGDFAKKTHIYVLRMQHDGSAQRIPFNYKEVIKGKNVSQNIQLEPQDTIVVP